MSTQDKDSARLKKNAQIKAAGQQTLQRRKTQAAKTYELKIVSNKLSIKQQETLEQMFLQAKWYYNDVISHLENNNLNDYNTKVKNVTVRMGSESDDFEERQLNILSSKMKQGFIEQVRNSLSALKALKSKGHKVGRLTYTKEVKSIPLNQYGNTHKLVENSSKIHIVKLGQVRVRGLHQIPQDAEISVANLIKKDNSYYVHLTIYVPLNIDLSWENRDDIGLDFNIGDTVVTSDGRKFKSRFEVSDRLKQLQRKLSRQEKGSKNYLKTLKNISKEYQDNSNKKNDMANKIVRDLLDSSGLIYIQDEMIKNWHSGLFGKQVQVSILGRLKYKLVKNPRVCVIDRSCATTQLCPKCGCLNKHSLDKRTYHCSCGYVKDRDIHSAGNMLVFAENEDNIVKNFGVGRTSTPVEWSPSASETSGSDVSCREETGNFSLFSVVKARR